MPTAYRKEVLTTGEVAKICHVAPRTVSKWFDSGKLRGYRIPGSRDRRIPLPQLLAFMRAHGIPLDEIEGGGCRVMILDESVDARFVETINDTRRYEVRSAANGFEAGVLAHQFRPHVVVLDVDAEPQEAQTICENIRASAELQAATVLAATRDCSDQRTGQFLKQGYDACLPKPFSPTELTAAIESARSLVY